MNQTKPGNSATFSFRPPARNTSMAQRRALGTLFVPTREEDPDTHYNKTTTTLLKLSSACACCPYRPRQQENRGKTPHGLDNQSPEQQMRTAAPFGSFRKKLHGRGPKGKKQLSHDDFSARRFSSQSPPLSCDGGRISPQQSRTLRLAQVRAIRVSTISHPPPGKSSLSGTSP